MKIHQNQYRDLVSYVVLFQAFYRRRVERITQSNMEKLPSIKIY